MNCRANHKTMHIVLQTSYDRVEYVLVTQIDAWRDAFCRDTTGQRNPACISPPRELVSSR